MKKFKGLAVIFSILTLLCGSNLAFALPKLNEQQLKQLNELNKKYADEKKMLNVEFLELIDSSNKRLRNNPKVARDFLVKGQDPEFSNGYSKWRKKVQEMEQRHKAETEEFLKTVNEENLEENVQLPLERPVDNWEDFEGSFLDENYEFYEASSYEESSDEN